MGRIITYHYSKLQSWWYNDNEKTMRWNERWYLVFLGKHHVKGLPKNFDCTNSWNVLSTTSLKHTRRISWDRGKQGGPTKWPWSALKYYCLIKSNWVPIYWAFTQTAVIRPLQIFSEVGWSSNLISGWKHRFKIILQVPYLQLYPPVIKSGNVWSSHLQIVPSKAP